MQSSSNSIKRHRDEHGYHNTKECSDYSIKTYWSKEIIQIFLYEIINRASCSHKSCILKTMSKTSSKECSFFRDLNKSINKALIISTSLFWIHLVDLHPSKNYLCRVREESTNKSTCHSCHRIKIWFWLSSGIWINPIIEVQQSTNSKSSARNSS